MNNTYIIREAVPDDAEKMISYLNQAGGESDPLAGGQRGGPADHPGPPPAVPGALLLRLPGDRHLPAADHFRGRHGFPAGFPGRFLPETAG